MPVTSNLLGKVVQNTIMSVTAVIRGCGPLLTVETFSTFLGSYDHEIFLPCPRSNTEWEGHKNRKKCHYH